MIAAAVVQSGSATSQGGLRRADFLIQVAPVFGETLRYKSMSKDLRNQIFISYSHRDKKWVERLQTVLKPIMHQENIVIWDDTTIKPGEMWKEKIENSLASAKVAVLLVSSEFLASDFIAENELPLLRNAAKKKGLHIIWVAVSASAYEQTEIARFQAANNPSKPLDSLSPAELKSELIKIGRVIKSRVESTQSNKGIGDREKPTEREGVTAKVTGTKASTISSNKKALSFISRAKSRLREDRLLSYLLVLIVMGLLATFWFPLSDAALDRLAAIPSKSAMDFLAIQLIQLTTLILCTLLAALTTIVSIKARAHLKEEKRQVVFREIQRREPQLYKRLHERLEVLLRKGQSTNV